MEQTDNKLLKITAIIFIILSLVFVAYATITNRGLYMDGSFYMMCLLKSFGDNALDSNLLSMFRVRFCIQFILDLPCIISYFLLKIEDKNVLMYIYSCFQFLYPLLVLGWSFMLSKRTKRFDIFFLSLFTYSLVLITYSIFSVSETLMGALLHFVLWNYMAAKTDYDKKDIFLITLLIVIMFGTWEYVIFLGPVFFIASLMYASREENEKNRIIKYLIGIGALAASVFDTIYMYIVCIKYPGNGSYFLKELYDYFPGIGELNILFSIIALVFLFMLFFRKDKISFGLVAPVTVINVFVFSRFCSILDITINPIFESHLRSITFWLMPLMFFGLYLYDKQNKQYNPVKLSNYMIIVLICGIFQTYWQCVNTYFWDKNVQYFKNEMINNKTPLYIADDHPEISSFFNNSLRRYIWWGNYAAMGILLSDTYKIRTLMVNYAYPNDDGSNGTFRDTLYVIPEENKMSIPYGVIVPIKNKYWDLTDCAEALDKYNKEHNIKTNF